jgi:hypothetical protein
MDYDISLLYLIPLIVMIAGIYYNHKGKIWGKKLIYISMVPWMYGLLLDLYFKNIIKED